MTEINLLPIEERAHEHFSLLVRRLSIVSIVILGMTALFTILTLAFFTSLVSKRSELIAEVEKSSGQIENLKATEELAVVVKEKALTSNKLLAARINFVSIFEKLAQIVPQGVYFTDAKFSAEKVVITGKARSSAEVAGLVSSLLSSEGRKILANISVDSLVSDEAGVFSFSMTAGLVK